MSLRERVSSAIARGDLAQNAREETSADVLGALARSDPLGAALWRVLASHDASALRNAIALLAQRLGMGVAEPFRSRIASKATEEWLLVLCPVCAGRGFTVSDTGVRATCWSCRGNGRGQHSAENRMLHLKVGPRQYAGMVAVFDRAHVILNAADGRVNRQLSHQLERRPTKPAKNRKKAV